MKSKITLLALVCLTLLSCSQPGMNKKIDITKFNLFARQSKFMWADNIRTQMISSAKELSPLKGNSTVKLSEYTLGFSTCNVDIMGIPFSNYRDLFFSEQYNPLYYSPHMILSYSLQPMADHSDYVIENMIKQYLMNMRVGDDRSDLVAYVDYRTTPVTKLKITCSHSIFGVNAGESLNDFFIISDYPKYHEFIISSNRRLITGKIKEIGIDKYLYYSPLAPAAIYLSFKEGLSITAPKEVKFTVELELEGENIIKATTKPITLTP